MQQDARVFSHPWLEALSEEYSTREPGVRLTPEEIWNYLQVPMDRRTTAGNRTITGAMQTLGYRKITVRTEDGKVVKGWGRE